MDNMFALGVTILTVLANAVLGLVIVRRNYRSATNRLFGLLTFIISIWAVLNYFSLQTVNPIEALFWIRAVMVSVAVMFPVIYLLAWVFPYVDYKVKGYLSFVVVLSTLFMVALSASPLIFEAVKVVEGKITPVPGRLIFLFGIHVIVYLLLTLVTLIQKKKATGGIYGAQIMMMSLGLGFTFVTSFITTFIFVVVMGATNMVILGPAYSIFLVGFIAYAIVRHRFLDITFLVARTVSYSLLLVVVVVVYSLLVFATSGLLPEGINRPYISIASAILIAFSFNFLKSFLESITDRIFFKGRYDSDKLLNRLSHIIASTLLLEDLADLVLRELTLQMKISYAALYIPLGKSAGTWVKDSVGFSKLKFELGSVAAVLEYVMGNKLEAPLIFDEMSESEIKGVMRNERISVVMPLLVKGELIGAVIFQEKSSGDIYSDQDVGVLTILAPELAVAIKNALAYHEISLFNITLQEEVKKATTELTVANEKLKELDKLKDEFVSIASHELRTPLTAIKGWLWIILNKDKKLDKATEKDLQSAVQSSDRLIALVNDMLDVSRIEGGRIELRKTVFDVGELAGTLAKDLQAKVDEKKLTLILPKAGGKVEADKDKAYQVLMNLVGNSIKFTPEKGKIEIRVKRAGGKIEVEVADTGVGIKKEDLPKLFSKFGRLDNSLAGISQVPGTGLGLYLSRKLVQLMGGKIRVESEEGKGSVFTFSLPFAKVK